MLIKFFLLFLAIKQNAMCRLLFYHFIVVSLCVHIGVSINNRFSKAEHLMHDAPEAALSILQSISPSDINSQKQRARYALLMSWALDKNYIDVNSDSLIRIAVDYYEKTSDHKKRMLAFYYEGIVLLNGKDYTSSAVYFDLASKEALILGDYLYLGLSNRALAQIMNETNNLTQAIVHDEIALEYFKKSGLETYELYEWLSLAIDCSNDRQYSRAIHISDSLLTVTDSPTLQGCFKLVIAGALMESGNNNYKAAVDIYRTIDDSLFELTDFGYYAYALDMIGKCDSADIYIDHAFSRAKQHVDSATVNVFRAKIENNRANYKNAYQLLSGAVNVQDSLTRNILRQSVSVAQKEFFNKEAQYQELRARNASMATLVTSLASLVLFLFVYFWFILRKKNQETVQKELIAQLAMERQKNKQLYAKNANILGSLFSERIGNIDKLAIDYMSAETTEDKERIFKVYKQRCSSIMKEKRVFDSLESDLNKYCDGIMEKLQVEVPKIKKGNRNIISLFFAGVPTISVQVLTGKPSRKAVDMDRARLRKLIKESGAEHTELFLEMLDTKKRQPKE